LNSIHINCCRSAGENAFWNSFGSASAITLTLAILPGRLLPPPVLSHAMTFNVDDLCIAEVDTILAMESVPVGAVRQGHTGWRVPACHRPRTRAFTPATGGP
jgi:hypothetical protein